MTKRAEELWQGGEDKRCDKKERRGEESCDKEERRRAEGRRRAVREHLDVISR